MKRATELDDRRGTALARDAARAVFDHSQIGMAVLDSTGALTETNSALRRLLGFDRDALVGRPLSSLVDRAHHNLCISTVETLVARGTPVRVDLRLRTPDDTECWVRVHLSRAPEEDTDPALIVGTFEDFTDEKKAENLAQATTRRIEQLVDRANDIIFNIDLDGRFTWLNPTASQLMKRPVDELLGMSFLDLVHPDYREDCGSFLPAPGPDTGSHRPTTSFPLSRPPATSSGWASMFSSSRKTMKSSTSRLWLGTSRPEGTPRMRCAPSEERLRAVVSTAPLILWAADREGVFTLCEGHGLKGLGLDPWDVSGQKVVEVYTDPSIAGHLCQALEGNSFHAEVTLGGRVFDSWYSPLRDSDRVITGVIGVAVDVTEHVRLSERLLDAEKMEAIGRLAGGVAHDFNNQLAAILGFAEILQRSFDEDDPRAADVRQIIREGRRAAALTEELLAFGRKQTRRPTVLDLNALLTSLEAQLRLTIRGDMHLDTQLAPDLWPITADEVQIERVIMNLALNSRDAMPTGGRLTICTANVMLDEKRVRKHPPLPSGPYTMVAVTDTGFGIDAETRSHLFEPFFTTKEQGKGTGMGLASAYGIIKQNGGFIEVESEVGCGSTFTFYLPSSATPASHPAPATPATTPPAKT